MGTTHVLPRPHTISGRTSISCRGLTSLLVLTYPSPLHDNFIPQYLICLRDTRGHESLSSKRCAISPVIASGAKQPVVCSFRAVGLLRHFAPRNDMGKGGRGLAMTRDFAGNVRSLGSVPSTGRV